MIRWEQPGYEVAFTTRIGGVSQGAYASLNLGALTADLAANVDENRRLACAGIGADPERLTLNRQIHSATAHEAVAGRRGVEGDGLWTAEPGLPLLALTADCVPIAQVVRAITHAVTDSVKSAGPEIFFHAIVRAPILRASTPRH